MKVEEVIGAQVRCNQTIAVVRTPRIAKAISTPKNPHGKKPTLEWKIMINKTLKALRPWISLIVALIVVSFVDFYP